MPIADKIKTKVPLAPYTTFNIGGPAEFFIDIKTKEELKEALAWAQEKDLLFYFLGGGSNILISDKGLSGLVLRLNNTKALVRGDRLYCEAGVYLAAAAQLATGHKLSGLEWAYGIPRATIGGAIRGNAGAFDTETSDLVETVEAYDAKKERFEMYSHKDCEFEYRGSRFKKNKNLLIWQATMKLSKAEAAVIKEKIETVLKFRSAKQPRLWSAGSIFKNLPPAYLKENNRGLYDRAIEAGLSPKKNIGAGLLIDWAGLKGKTIGGAKVSLEHANFIVNTGKATAEDVIVLISYIKQQLRDKFGVQLWEEIEYLGF